MKLAVSEIRLENAQRRLPETPIARVEPTIADATQLTATAYLLGRLQDRPNPLARLQAGNLAQLLQPLESTTAIPHETVTKVIDTALDGAKEITVDGVKQGLGKLLEDSKKEVSESGHSRPIIQICVGQTTTPPRSKSSPPVHDLSSTMKPTPKPDINLGHCKA
jgi:hypothetical protein